MCHTTHGRIISAVASIALLTAAGSATAAGFAIVEQDARDMGSALSGAAVSQSDASAMFFNPASIGGITNAQVVAGVHLILPTAEFTDNGSTPVGGGNGGDAGVTAWVPNLFAAMGLTERISLGLSVTAPYGLKTEYDEDWIGRYAAISTELKTMNITPTLGVKLCNRLALGAGFSAQYAEAELSSAAPTPAGDMIATITGDDWAYGFTLGAQCNLPCGTRLGLSYRYGIDHELEGDIAVGPLPKEAGTAELNLPDVAQIGIYHPLCDRVALMADATWTGWSSFEELSVVRNDGAIVSMTDENWEDVWRFALGTEVAATDCLTLRAGVAYDESPIPDPAHRTPRIPDADRIWASIGAGCHLTDMLALDLAYVHIWIDDSDINHVYDATTGARITGSYESCIDIVSLQLKLTL